MKKSFSLLILFAVFLSACSGQGQTQSVTGSFAGQVEGTSAFIGLVRNGEQLMAFYCDGTTEAAPELWGWFRGEVSGNAFDLTNDNGDRLTGEFSSNSASGTITPANGTGLTFQAERVNEPAGLYRLEETIDGLETVTGWIQLANGEVRGGKKSGNQLLAAPGRPDGFVKPIIVIAE
jgi:hypothetical protein